MYNPKPFEESDRDSLLEFIRRQPFASLITARQEDIQVSHIPLYHASLQGRDYLVGHLSKANSQWESIAGKGLAIFNGPHAYVSHKWYGTPNVVPTWNYVVTHVTGTIFLTGPEELERILDQMMGVHEGGSSGLRASMTEQFYDNLAGHIVGIKMEIGKMEGKWKLSQNKPAAAQAKVAEGLAQSDDWNARQIAGMMIRNLARKQ